MENQNIILEFLKNFRVDMDNKLDSMKSDINDKFKAHSEWIDNTEKKTETATEKMGKRIGTLEQENAVLKFQMKIIGIISGTAFAGAVSLLISILTRGK